MNARERQSTWDLWSDNPVWLRRSSVVSVALGLVLLILGLWGDAAGFWEGRDYLTSMVSGLTGLAFGIPAALLIYSRLTEARADADLRRWMLRRARAAGADFHRAVYAAFVTDDRDTVLEALTRVRNRNGALARALHRALGEPADTDELHRLVDERNGAWRTVGRRRSGKRSISRMYVRVVQVEWREVLATRGRVHEAGLEWLDTRSVVSMNDSTEDLGRGAYSMFETHWGKRINQLADLPAPSGAESAETDRGDGLRREVITELRLATREVNVFLEALIRLVGELPHTLARPPGAPADRH